MSLLLVVKEEENEVLVIYKFWVKIGRDIPSEKKIKDRDYTCFYGYFNVDKTAPDKSTAYSFNAEKSDPYFSNQTNLAVKAYAAVLKTKGTNSEYPESSSYQSCCIPC